MAEWTLAPGARVRCRDLHSTFGGSFQGGISCSNDAQNVLVFTLPESGARPGYMDSWADDGCFHFTGEGQRGDQQMTGGNRALMEAGSRGQTLRETFPIRRRLR